MNIGEAPKNFKNLGINTDTVHLMALNDQLAQMRLWATAAQATVQVLLAKRAQEIPEAVELAPSRTVVPTTLPSVSTPTGKISKADLLQQGEVLGVPKEFLTRKEYLNEHGRPSEEGVQKTLELFEKIKGIKAAGQDPSGLWGV